MSQKVILKTLNKLGYSPTIVENGAQAVKEAVAKDYELILMDVQMPEMDGLDATRAIRQKLGDDPIIIALTANAMQGDADLCINAGMNDYLSKPIRLEDVSKAIEKWGVLLKQRAKIGSS
jgi:CheY-like chemotaxis protein